MFSVPTIKKSIGIICAVVGIAMYIIGYAFLEFNTMGSNIVINIADVLIIGVVVGYLSSVAQWSGVFKREIQDIVYGREFLGERKDIECIWNNVTKQLIKNRFSDIHKDLLSAIRKTAIPSDDSVSYYEDHDSDIRLDWIDFDKGIVKSTEAITFTLVAESEKKISLPIKTTTIIEKNAEWSVSDPNILVDGKKPEMVCHEPIRDGHEITHTASILLQGKKQYNVSYTREKIYCIYEDYYIGFKSQYLLKNLTVTLNLPDRIEATFIERSTNIPITNVKNDKDCIKKKLKGVIFPKQGYIFALKVVPKSK